MRQIQPLFIAALLLVAIVGLPVDAGEPPAGEAAKQRVLFTSNRQAKDTFQIYAMAEDGANVTRISKKDALEFDAVFSPDGKRIALAGITGSNRFGPTSAIFVTNADGSARKQLTDGKSIAAAPAWSPDGKRIAYSALDRPPGPRAKSALIVMDAEGKNRKDLGEGVFPAWSPDGKRIAYSVFGENGRPTLHIRGVDGGKAKKLVDGVAMMAHWSPDGKRVAYLADGGDDQPDLFVMNADGAGKTKLTNSPAYEMGLRWSADGKRILFTRGGRGFMDPNNNIFVIDADGRNERQLTKHESVALLPGASMFLVQRFGRGAEKANTPKPQAPKREPAKPNDKTEQPKRAKPNVDGRPPQRILFSSNRAGKGELHIYKGHWREML